MMEWRQSAHPMYEISENGRLRSTTSRSNRVAGTILRGTVKRGGYIEYKLQDHDQRGRGSSYTRWPAHQLVLLAFVGPRPTPQHQCAHWDGNPCNNHHSNLRWATAAENTADKVRHGNIYQGRRKYTTEQVLNMRAMREEGSKYSDIMDKHNISKGNLSAILNRQTWDWV
jgi:hypothetical protein